MIGSGKLNNTLVRAGIVEAGAPSFPVHPRIFRRAPEEATSTELLTSAERVLIINGFDIEPNVMVRRAAVQNKIDDIVAGIKLLQQATA